MRSLDALIRDFLEIRPHFASLGSWLLEPVSRAVKHTKIGSGRACAVKTRALGTVWLRLGDSDFRTLLEISRGEYDVCSKRLRSPKNILDLGANVGLSVRLWRLEFPDARVVAIEPDEASARLLVRNVREGPRPELTDIVVAAVNEDGRQSLLDRSGDSDAHKVGFSGVPVDGIAIGEAIRRAAGSDGTVDLVKMDIEGSERPLMACVQAWAPQVRHLLIEIHGDYTEALLFEDLATLKARPKVEFLRSASDVATYFISFTH
jgi:FkbM family methyltransferase